MQRRVPPVLRACVALALATLCAACGGGADTAPAVGRLAVSLSRARVALGSPVDVSYTFTLAPDAPALGTRKVFVHFLDANDELMWVDDHEPPTPTAEWKPGQTIEYTRTMFVGRHPYVGAASVVAGLYSPESGDRLMLSNEDRGDRSYAVAAFELLPQTESVFVVFKDGWHPAEMVGEGASRVEWQWTKKEATVAFRNPARDVVLYLQADNPSGSANAAQQLEVRLGDQVLGTVPLRRDGPVVQKIPITAAQMGSADMVELRFIADKTIVPALEPGGAAGDSRELGARVFHAAVQ
ncbi:MAG: hypothetical protein IT179_12615 [Acidobacteria bacterium]|nr:hypothetical protein [Acidobacteriota bacterium]